MHNHPTPKFSIITVTYNAEAVLEDTIQSVISQTYHHCGRCVQRQHALHYRPLPRPHHPHRERTGQGTVRRHEQRHPPCHRRLPLLPQCRRQLPRRRHLAADGAFHLRQRTTRRAVRRNGTGGQGRSLHPHASRACWSAIRPSLPKLPL